MNLSAYQTRIHRALVAADVTGGVLFYQGAAIPAAISPFTQRFDLTTSGYDPNLSTTAEVAAEDIPANLEAFRTGWSVTARPRIGPERLCRIDSVTQTGALWQLTLASASK